MKAILIPDGVSILTDKSVEIVQLLSDGNSASEVAGLMAMNTRTIEAHITRLKKTAEAKNIPHLVAIFIRSGYIE